MATAIDLFNRPELIPRTARFMEIDTLDRVFRGKQYEGRPDWWTGKSAKHSDEVPLRERRPCVIYKLPRAAVQQVVRFLFGEKRFPKISFEVSKDGGEEWLPQLSTEEATTLGEWVSSLIDSANLQPNVRAIATKAIACRTAVVIVELDEGQFRIQLPRPQDCHAKFKDDNPEKPVDRLVWCYEFDKEILDHGGNPTTARMIFRREWDDRNVYIYDDVELKQAGKKVEWGTPEITPHGLTFCPVLWIRNEAEYAHGADGISLYDDLCEEFEALDMTLSRRHQGVITLGAPQMVETGVEPGDGPDATGRKGGPDGFSGGQGNAEFRVAPKARRIAPDCVWTYEGKDVSVELLETSGKAFDVGTSHVNDIRSRILETMGVVLTSMADTISRVTTGADMSARFLALAHAPLIALVQEYRHTWWPKALKPLLSMMMRMTVSASARGEMVAVPGTTSAVAILARFQSPGGAWTCPQMAPHWGRFFDPSSQEIKTSVDATTAAHGGKLISHETAVEFVSHDFGVDSVEVEIEEIEEDERESLERDMIELKRLGVNDEDEGATGGGAQGRPEDDGQGGSGATLSASAKVQKGDSA